MDERITTERARSSKGLGFFCAVSITSEEDPDPLTSRVTPKTRTVEKKISQTVKEVKREHPEARVEAWAEDEHRIGLKPINRIIWVQKGENPIADVNWKFEWLWLVGFVHPQSGETYSWWIVPKLNLEVFGEILADFAKHFRLGAQRRMVLALDQASFQYQ
jgi:hypothetical protein